MYFRNRSFHHQYRWSDGYRSYVTNAVAEPPTERDIRCCNRWNCSVYLFGRCLAIYCNNVLHGLAAGVHSIEVKDANGCFFTTAASINNANGPTALATSVTNASCGAANGTMTLGAVTGGTAPYTYSVKGICLTSTLDYLIWQENIVYR